MPKTFFTVFFLHLHFHILLYSYLKFSFIRAPIDIISAEKECFPIHNNFLFYLRHIYQLANKTPRQYKKIETFLFLAESCLLTPKLTVNEKVFFVASYKCYQHRLRSRWALFISSVLCLVNLLVCTIFENICLPLLSIN